MSRARRSHALRRRYGHASGGVKASARTIERRIAEIEAGQSEGSHDDVKVFNSINKLEDRIYKTWRSTGDDAARAEGEAVAQALRARMRAAVDTGFHARQARRNAEIRGITERERERIANMSSSERALYNYQQELKLTRGGR